MTESREPSTHAANADGTADTPADRAVVDLYDRRMYDGLVDEYYGSSGFLNFGYWDDEVNSAGEAGARLVDELLSMGDSPGSAARGARVLDVACGTGATTARLASVFGAENVTAVNLSAKQLATARSRNPGCRFARMDAARLALADATFDEVVCVEAAFHFNTREAFLREVCRVLRPGGVLVLSDALIHPQRGYQRPHWNPENLIPDPDAYAALCRGAGFVDVTVVDATERCWKPCFWNIVTFVHEKLWEREITLSQKDDLLERVYRLAGDLEYYVLVSARKGL